MANAAAERALNDAFGALANRDRRRLLRELRRGPLPTPAIAGQFDFSKQALSRHLAVLEHAGLIERHTRGRIRYIRLAPAPLQRVSNWIFELRRGWQASLDRLDRVLEEHR